MMQGSGDLYNDEYWEYAPSGWGNVPNNQQYQQQQSWGDVLGNNPLGQLFSRTVLGGMSSQMPFGGAAAPFINGGQSGFTQKHPLLAAGLGALMSSVLGNQTANDVYGMYNAYKNKNGQQPIFGTQKDL